MMEMQIEASKTSWRVEGLLLIQVFKSSKDRVSRNLPLHIVKVENLPSSPSVKIGHVISSRYSKVW